MEYRKIRGITMEDEDEITNTTLLGQLKAGDHIACSRLGGIFEHHGIYMGFVDGFHKVIHVKAPVKRRLSSMISSGAASSSDEDNCSICGFKPPKDGGRVTSCLRCFSKGKQMYIIRYRVPLPYTPNGEDLKTGNILRGYRSKKLYLELNKGSGELFGHMIIPHNDENLDAADNLVLISKYASSRSPDEILQVAQSNYDVGKYNLFLNNCEHFSVYCITGEEQSIQAEKKIPKLHVLKKVFYDPFTNKGKEKMKEKASKYFGP